ncbi:aspartic peptidase domain-containing protein [Aspergillus germanicus]
MAPWAMIPLDSPTVLSAPAVLDGGYWINVSVGTPPQSLAMLFNVDKVFSRLMYPVLAHLPCTAHECEEAANFGSFDPARSRSYEPIAGGADRWDSPMYLYSEGSDILTIDGEDAEGLEFQLVPLADEFSADMSRRLVDQGLTASLSFSMWNTPESDEAGLLFRGINTAKYLGPLHCFPMDLPFSASSPRVTLPLNGVELQLGNSTSKSKKTGSYDFPQSPCPGIARGVELPCSRQTEGHTIIFKIGNTTISAPWTAFITETPQADSDFDSGPGCSFNIYPADVRFRDGEIGQLGPNITQHMYLAVDEDTEMAFTRCSPPTPLVTTVTSTQGAVRTAAPGFAVAGLAGLAFVL